MFTGLVQKVGRLVAVKPRSDGKRICIRHDPWTEPLERGESVAVQGACLTVAVCSAGEFECDVLRETLDRTTLSRHSVGAEVNLERALRASDRLGGHFVTGHVDGVGRVTDLKLRGADWILEVESGPDMLSQLVQKGSITIDGVSLTIAGMTPRAFSVHLIPHTWENTSLHNLREGGHVNLETDILGKYVMRYVQGSARGGVTLEALTSAGFH